MRAPVVIVHPSWPWESKADLPSVTREATLEQCGLILARLADEVEFGGKSFVVGPWVSRASFLPQAVEEDIARIAARAIHIKGGLGEENFHAAASDISRQLPDAAPIRLAGFWSNLCVHGVGCALQTYGHQTKLNRDWTMALHRLPADINSVDNRALPPIPSLQKVSAIEPGVERKGLSK